jgi:hypothetical protein
MLTLAARVFDRLLCFGPLRRVVRQQILGRQLVAPYRDPLAHSDAVAALAECVQRTEWEYVTALKMINKIYDVAILE